MSSFFLIDENRRRMQPSFAEHLLGVNRLENPKRVLASETKKKENPKRVFFENATKHFADG